MDIAISSLTARRAIEITFNDQGDNHGLDQTGIHRLAFRLRNHDVHRESLMQPTPAAAPRAYRIPS
jgi:hypothetical protein